MKKYTFLLLAIFLASCGASQPSSADVALTMMSDKVHSEATQAVVNSMFTATAQIQGVTATYEAAGTQVAVTQQARIDAEATAQQSRNDAQATAEQGRKDAQATQQRSDADATQAQGRRDMEIQATQMRLDIESTQQAQATAMAFQMTQVVIPTHNLWTQQAVEQQIIIGTNQVELSNLEVQQQQQTNTVDWALPALGAICLTVTAVVYILRHSNTREIKNDDGDIEMILIGGKQAIRPALLTGPVLDLHAMTMPDLASSVEEQSRVTERAQAIEALKAMPVATTPSAGQAFNKYFGTTPEQPYDIVDTDALPAGLVDVESLKSLEGDWMEAKGE